MLGNNSTSLEIGDLPIVPADMRATFNYAAMKRSIKQKLYNLRLRVPFTSLSWQPKPGSGFSLGYRLFRINLPVFIQLWALASISAVLFYAPYLFMQKLVRYLEVDPERKNRGWGWVYVLGLFACNATAYLGEYTICMLSLNFHS